MKELSQTPKLFKGLKLFLGLAALALIVLTTSCGDDDGPSMTEEDPGTLSEVAAEAGLTTLIDAANAADLVADLESREAITVFAPTNDAFGNLLTASNVSNLTELIAELGASRVSDILGYHVVASAAFSSSLSDGQQLTTLAGQTLTVNLAGDGSVSISDVSGKTFDVVTADVEIANGVVHVIDGVLISTPTVADVAFANDLTILLQALEIAGLTQTLLDQSDMTVFAPTDAAFTALLGTIGQTSLDDIPVSVLTRILQYHVLGSSEFSTDLQNNQEAATLLSADDKVTVTISGSDVDINDSNVTIVDVEIVNGVVHVIDAVLVPSLELSIVNTIVQPAYFNKDFSVLTAAVVKADLVGTLTDTQASFTLFAPNNAAFEAAGITSLDNLSKDDLDPILKYHVINSEIFADELPDTEGAFAEAVTTLNGDIYLTNNAGGAFINGNSEVVVATNADEALDFGNGVVHVIDRMLSPASVDVVGIAQDAGFTLLAAALTEAGLVSDLQVTDANFTVFAPTNAAFSALYSALEVSGPSGVDEVLGSGTLSTVLLYHVFNQDRVFSTDLTNGLGVSTMAEVGFTVEIGDDGAVTLNDQDSSENPTVTGTDNLATNGVVHIIDKVLLPIEVTNPE